MTVGGERLGGTGRYERKKKENANENGTTKRAEWVCVCLSPDPTELRSDGDGKRERGGH